MWMNFLPFGAGQFLQDRVEWGAVFAISEGIFAITSIVALTSAKITPETTPVVAPASGTPPVPVKEPNPEQLQVQPEIQ
jgi:hypothetical protein